MFDPSAIPPETGETGSIPPPPVGKPSGGFRFASSKLVCGALIAVDVVMLVALIPVRPLSLPLHVALILTALSLPIMVTRYLLATFDDSHPKLAEFPSRSSFDTLASAIEFVGTGATSGALLFCFLHVNWIAGVTFLVAGGLGFLVISLYGDAAVKAWREREIDRTRVTK